MIIFAWIKSRGIFVGIVGCRIWCRGHLTDGTTTDPMCRWGATQSTSVCRFVYFAEQWPLLHLFLDTKLLSDHAFIAPSSKTPLRAKWRNSRPTGQYGLPMFSVILASFDGHLDSCAIVQSSRSIYPTLLKHSPMWREKCTCNHSVVLTCVRDLPHHFLTGESHTHYHSQLSRVKLCRKWPERKGKLVQISARFELLGVNCTIFVSLPDFSNLFFIFSLTDFSNFSKIHRETLKQLANFFKLQWIHFHPDHPQLKIIIIDTSFCTLVGLLLTKLGKSRRTQGSYGSWKS